MFGGCLANGGKFCCVWDGSCQAACAFPPGKSACAPSTDSHITRGKHYPAVLATCWPCSRRLNIHCPFCCSSTWASIFYIHLHASSPDSRLCNLSREIYVYAILPVGFKSWSTTSRRWLVREVTTGHLELKTAAVAVLSNNKMQKP